MQSSNTGTDITSTAPVAEPAAPAHAQAVVGTARKAAAKPAAKALAKPLAKKKAAPAAPKPVAKKAAAKPAKAVAKPAAKPAAKPSAKPATKAAAKTAAKTAEAKTAKEKKIKMVRDSISIPKAEYQVLDTLKLRAAKLAVPTKKTELIRAGIKALAALSDTAFLAAVRAVPNLKTGRPAKSA